MIFHQKYIYTYMYVCHNHEMLIVVKFIPNSSQLIRISQQWQHYWAYYFYNANKTRPNFLTGSEKQQHQSKTFTCIFVSRHLSAIFVWFGGLITGMVLRSKRGGRGLLSYKGEQVLRFFAKWTHTFIVSIKECITACLSLCFFILSIMNTIEVCP